MQSRFLWLSLCFLVLILEFHPAACGRRLEGMKFWKKDKSKKRPFQPWRLSYYRKEKKATDATGADTPSRGLQMTVDTSTEEQGRAAVADVPQNLDVAAPDLTKMKPRVARTYLSSRRKPNRKFVPVNKQAPPLPGAAATTSGGAKPKALLPRLPLNDRPVPQPPDADSVAFRRWSVLPVPSRPATSLESVWPTVPFISVGSLVAALKAAGVKGVAFDFDNTLTPSGLQAGGTPTKWKQVKLTPYAVKFINEWTVAGGKVWITTHQNLGRMTDLVYSDLIKWNKPKPKELTISGLNGKLTVKCHYGTEVKGKQEQLQLQYPWVDNHNVGHVTTGIMRGAWPVGYVLANTPGLNIHEIDVASFYPPDDIQEYDEGRDGGKLLHLHQMATAVGMQRNQIVLVDDKSENCDLATEAGYHAIYVKAPHPEYKGGIKITGGFVDNGIDFKRFNAFLE